MSKLDLDFELPLIDDDCYETEEKFSKAFDGWVKSGLIDDVKPDDEIIMELISQQDCNVNSKVPYSSKDFEHSFSPRVCMYVPQIGVVTYVKGKFYSVELKPEANKLVQQKFNNTYGWYLADLRLWDGDIMQQGYYYSPVTREEDARSYTLKHLRMARSRADEEVGAFATRIQDILNCEICIVNDMVNK